MSLWPSLRLPILAIAFVGSFLALIQSVIQPTKEPTPFSFPQQLPLSSWKLVKSSTLDSLGSATENNYPGWRYQYVQANVPVNLELRYITRTDGNVGSYIYYFSDFKSSYPTIRQFQQQNQYLQDVRHRKGKGYFVVYTFQQNAYLSACINPRGETTFTPEQFVQNSNTHDLQIGRLIPWLIGQQDLRDNRCLWARLSTPLTKTGSEQAIQTLEKFWFALLASDLRQHFPLS